jgi:uncharacterized membrane protein YfbV (UPF0208 family)
VAAVCTRCIQSALSSSVSHILLTGTICCSLYFHLLLVSGRLIAATELNSKLLDICYSVQMKSAFGSKTLVLMKMRFIQYFSYQESHKKGLLIVIINKVHFCYQCSEKKTGSLFLDD